MMLDAVCLQSFPFIDLTTVSSLLAQVPTDPTAEEVEKYAPFINLASLISYLIIAYFSWEIFKKLNVENAWFAWFPILGSYITFVAGDNEKPILWTILLFIPCLNIIAIFPLIGAWIKICEKLGKSPWLLLLCILPCINFLVFGYLAFG